MFFCKMHTTSWIFEKKNRFKMFECDEQILLVLFLHIYIHKMLKILLRDPWTLMKFFRHYLNESALMIFAKYTLVKMFNITIEPVDWTESAPYQVKMWQRVFAVECGYALINSTIQLFWFRISTWRFKKKYYTKNTNIKM